jgi:hypothetical protein
LLTFFDARVLQYSMAMLAAGSATCRSWFFDYPQVPINWQEFPPVRPK